MLKSIFAFLPASVKKNFFFENVLEFRQHIASEMYYSCWIIDK